MPAFVESTRKPSEQQRTWLFAIACFFFALGAFYLVFSNNNWFNTEIQNAPGVVQLEAVEQTRQPNNPAIVTDGGKNREFWTQDDGLNKQTKNYRVYLPADAEFKDHVLYIPGHRHQLELRYQNIVLATQGEQKVFWIAPIITPMTVTLDALAATRTPGQRHYVDIKFSPNSAASGSFVGIWYGHKNAVNDARNLFIEWMPWIIIANIGILSAFIVFLGIDATLAPSSRGNVIVAVPHLVFSISCLPLANYLSSHAWLFLFIGSIAAVLILWCHYALKNFTPVAKLLRIPSALLAFGTLPLLFLESETEAVHWLYFVIYPAGILYGLGFFWLLLSNAPTGGDHWQLYYFYFIQGASVLAAGFVDFQDYIELGSGTRCSAIAIALLTNTLYLIALTAQEMYSRNCKLLRHKKQQEALLCSRTEAMEKAQGELMHHQRYETLNLMGAAISHEIRNPLGSLNADLALLSQRCTHDLPEIGRPIARMRGTVSRIDNIIADLSDYSRQQKIKIETASLSEWLSTAIAHHETQSLCASTLLKVSIDAKVCADFDPEQMRRAFVNVLENAVQALHRQPDGQIRIRLERVDCRADIVISDNGPGFATADLDTLLEPMVSLKNSGMGLGLAIARDIMAAHQGEVVLDASSPEAGAQVRLSLPIRSC